MRIILYLTFLFILISINNAKSQDVAHFGTWDMGLNFGFYKANGYSANFYNGNSSNENKMSFIIGNKYHYEEISRELNSTDTFFVAELPGQMRYPFTPYIGLYFRKTFDKYIGFSLQFNYSKLKTTDVFTINVDPNNIILSEPDLRIFPIWGIEERVNIDLLFSKYFKLQRPDFVPYFEAGLNINSTKVLENKINIGNLTYSLVDLYLNQSYVPGAQLNEYVIKQGGMGWGISAALGLKMLFGDRISIDPSFIFYLQKVNLTNYTNFKPAFVFNVRMSMTTLLMGDGTVTSED